MKIDKLREMSKASSPKPWKHIPCEKNEGLDHVEAADGNLCTGGFDGEHEFILTADAELIAAMRNHFDLMLDVVEKSEKLILALIDKDLFIDEAMAVERKLEALEDAPITA